MFIRRQYVGRWVELNTLVRSTVAWALGIVQEESPESEGERDQIRRDMSGVDPSKGVFLE